MDLQMMSKRGRKCGGIRPVGGKYFIPQKKQYICCCHFLSGYRLQTDQMERGADTAVCRQEGPGGDRKAISQNSGRQDYHHQTVHRNKRRNMRDLTTGNIRSSIWSMAIPLITASFVQMAYNMTDMIWLGHLGSECVAAVGVAGFYTWLCNSLSFIGKVGGEVTISQSLGAKKFKQARAYANQAAMLSLIISVTYALSVFLASPLLVSLFSLEAHISDMAVEYMKIVSFGIFFTFNNNTFSGIYNGQGNSRTPLKIVATGLVTNMILDPLLIYGLGPVPGMGTAGAGIATTLSQMLVFGIFTARLYWRKSPIGHLRFIVLPRKRFMGRVAALGLPVSMQSGLFAMIGMLLGSMAATFGYIGVAVQSIGAQIEAITWMTGAGFSTALAAFVGQNYGARNFERIQKGYRYTLKLALSIAGVATVVFLLFGRQLFRIFVADDATLDAGKNYMLILAVSQLFVSLEAVSAGAFNGCGRTIPPAVTGISLNLLRLPLAWFLMRIPELGMNGIWISITVSSILKGVMLRIWYGRFRAAGYSTGSNTASITGSKSKGTILRPFGKMYAIASRLWQQ